MMVVHPDRIWYGRLTPALLQRIVIEHLVAGRPVTEAIIHHLPMETPAELTGGDATA